MHLPARGLAAAIAATAALVVPAVAEAAYPQQNVLPVWPDNPNDASASIGDIPYDEIAPKLNALQAASNRISARVGGKSSGGYDLYVVTVTAPETDAEQAQQDAWRQLLEDDPVRARQDPDLLARYKTPLFINGNIHGNEKEGTDAIVRVIEQWATSTDPAVEQLLQRNRIMLNVTSNPDGRVANTRANAAGYDLNRDLTIASQPEARLIRDLIVQTRPIITLDLHGYVNPTLLHPSTPPHNVNNEYDLFIKHALPNALNIEQGMIGLGYPEVTRARIPFRDDAPGVWDDFPPIYVPSFALLQSSIPYTIEAPLQPGSGSTATRRADIDTDVHEVAIKTSLKYIQDHRNEVLFDQAEVYRRGWAGEPLRQIPDGYVPGWGPEDNYNTTFPRSYVIPAGDAPALRPGREAPGRPADRQRRPHHPGQGRLHGRRQHLSRRNVRDQHPPAQARHRQFVARAGHRPDRPRRRPVRRPRGLEPGSDLGRDGRHPVGRAADGRDRARLRRRVGRWRPRAEHRPAAGSAGRAGPARGERAARAGRQGPAPHRRHDPRAGQRPRARGDPGASSSGVTFKAPPASWSGATLDKVVVAYVGGSELRDTLDALGFEKKVASATTLATTLTSDVDVLAVGGTLNYANLNAANRAALDAFLARGGGVVGLGTAGSAFSTASGVLTATGTSATGLASGVANLVNHGGPVSNGAQPHAFVFPPVWYSNLGTGAVVEQSYAADPLAAGWWRASNTTNSQEAAAGKASIVRAQGRTVSGAGPDRHQRGHAPARQGPAAAARPRDPVGRRADRVGRVDLDRRHRRRLRPRDADAGPGRAGDVPGVHPGRREHLRDEHDGPDRLDRGRRRADRARPVADGHGPPGQRVVLARAAAAGGQPAAAVGREDVDAGRPPTSP